MSVKQRIPLGTIAYLGSPYVIMDPFCWALAQLVQFNNEYVCGPEDYIHIARSVSTDRALSRNTLAREFIGDWLLMLDADHVFDPDLVLRLLVLFESANLDVLTGVYVSKNPPYNPLLQWREKPDDGWKLISSWGKHARLIEVGRAGAGCLLIRRRVFDRIASVFGEEPFAYNNNYSEDYSFFTRCEQIGIKCHAAAQVNVDHLILQSVNYSNFDQSAFESYKPTDPVPTFYAAASS